MKKLISLLFVLLTLSASSQTWTARSGVSMGGTINGFYEYKPASYNGVNKLPVIIFLHGLGEVGNGTTDLYKVKFNGLPKFIDQQGFPYDAMVICPQFSAPWPGSGTLGNIITYVRNNYAVDTSRIYFTGLSMGGGAILDWGDAGLIYQIAAMAPVCPASTYQSVIGNRYKFYGMPMWFFHGTADGTVPYSNSTGWVNNLNAVPAIIPGAQLTPLTGYDHNIWDEVYAYTYNIGNGQNIYQWLLSKSRGGANQLPVAIAGADQTITLPTASVTLNASASNDPNGSIVSSVWSKVSGPASGSITTANTLITTFTGLVTGTYVMRITVTDNNGATATDDVVITVNPAVNTAPVANAGGPKSIVQPSTQVTVTGSGTDADGSVIGYSWSYVSGPNAVTFSQAGSATTNVSGLTSVGIYTIRLTVTDNLGATATSTADITVFSNQPPLAGAGSDVIVTLPQDSIQLSGLASDIDGSVSGTLWTKVSGPSGGNIGTPAQLSTWVRNLVQGTYVMRLTVTDNATTTAFDDVVILVNPTAVNGTPVVTCANKASNKTSVRLVASAYDPNGAIVGILWTQTSGPTAATFSTTTSLTTNISGLTQDGNYGFRVRVTDNSGNQAFANVSVIKTSKFAVKR